MSPTLPLFPSDDGWPYPDVTAAEFVADAPDLDALEMQSPMRLISMRSRCSVHTASTCSRCRNGTRCSRTSVCAVAILSR